MNLKPFFEFKFQYLGVIRALFFLMLAASTSIDAIPPILPPTTSDDPIQLEQAKVHKIQFYAALEAESHHEIYEVEHVSIAFTNKKNIGKRNKLFFYW